MVRNAVSDLVQQRKATIGGRSIRTSYDQIISSLAEIRVDMTASALGAQVRRSIGDVPALGDCRYADPDDDDSDGEDAVPELSPRGGRPKGSTDMQKKEDETRYQDCVHAISYDYSIEQTTGT